MLHVDIFVFIYMSISYVYKINIMNGRSINTKKYI